MDWQKVELQKYVKWLPYLAVISVLSYVSAISFQLGYYSAFKVDLFLINPRVDPTSLSTILIAVIFVALAVVEIYVLNKLANTKSLVAAIAADLLAAVALSASTIMYFINRDEIIERLGEDPFRDPIVSIVPIALLIMIVVRTVTIIKKCREGKGWVEFKDAYISTVWLRQDKAAKTKRGKAKRYDAHLVALSVVSILVFVVSPALVGENFAKGREYFPIVEPKAKSDNKVTVLVGSTASGYITKEYDISKKKFDENWGINSEDNLKLQPIKLKSIKDQEEKN